MNHVERVGELMERVLVVGVSPEQSRELIASATVVARHGEYGEESQRPALGEAAGNRA